jgi:hypothetical protein
MEELGMYLVSFDRAKYGKSDPNARRDVKSKALDIKELADQLNLGQKLHVLWVLMGGHSIWRRLQYIPHRQTHRYSQIHVNEICNSYFRVKLYMLY